jgi:hypothetical protein
MTATMVVTQPPRAAAGTEPPATGESSGLLEQARGWVGVARTARQNCAQGSNAQQELTRRQNRSAQ